MRIEAMSLRGSAYERGRLHGAALSQRITAHLETWLQSLLRPPVTDAHSYIEGMLRETQFLPAIREHTPELLEEIDGIADGASLPRHLVFAMQLLDEEWAYRASADRRAPSEKCSSLAVVTNEECSWLAQNMDLGAYTDGYQCLLRIEDEQDGEALVFSLAGMIALLGVNAHGLGVCVNSLPQLRSSSTGLPVAFVIRKLLQSATVEEATSVLMALPHATSQHYLLAEAGNARSFEASADAVAEYRPGEGLRIFHTNHPLTGAVAIGGSEDASENSRIRLQSLTARLASGPVGLREIGDALSSFDDPMHPVCRIKREGAGHIGFTTGSMIAALRARPRRSQAWVSAGPPVAGGYSGPVEVPWQ